MVVPLSRLGREYNPLHTRGTPVLPMIYIGFVKKNEDAQRMGRLAVWIPEIGGDPDDESSWLIVSYASPFAGATDYKLIRPDSQTMDGSQKSYGWWGIPPDINNEVAIFFANGDLARGYWFACTYQQKMNWMVPGIATNITTEPSPPIKTGPVVEYNKANVQSTSSPRRPRFLPLSGGLSTEGLTSDDERGSSSTSARREAPSQVFGYLTPRGNTIHIDDQHTGDYNGQSVNEFIRLRTRSGTQVLIHETTGYVYINSKNGQAWLEVSDAGVDIYSANSVSIRAEHDFNIRADRNINLDAGGNIALRAGHEISMETGDLQIGTSRSMILTTTGNGSIHASQDLQVKADANLRFESESGETSMKAGGRQVRDGASGIYDNGGLAQSTSGSDATVPKGKVVNDTKQTFSGNGSGSTVWKAGAGTVNTIVSRMPTHEPWSGHPNSRVPPPPTEDVIPGNGGTGSAGDTSPLNSEGCGFGAAGTKPISTDVYNAISNASSKTGAPMATMLAIADQESSFNPGVSASTSSATGLYQFISGTYNGMVTQYGNKYNVAYGSQTDANSNALMGGQLIQDNAKVLQNAGISDPTPGQIYLLHFLGNGAGPKFIQQAQSNPDAPAASAFPAAAAANRSIFYNSDGSSKTMGQVYNNLTGKIDSKATAYASQYGLPAPCQRGNGVSGNNPTSPGSKGSADPGAYAGMTGKYYGESQQCVALVKDVTGLGPTATWAQGQNVQQAVQSGNLPPIGTGIATFGSQGTYTNSLDGSSHAAVITGYPKDASGNVTGVQVFEQYAGSGGAKIHTYYFNDTSGNILKNGSNYSIINTRSA